MVVHVIKILAGRERKEEREEHGWLFRRPLGAGSCNPPEEYASFLKSPNQCWLIKYFIRRSLSPMTTIPASFIYETYIGETHYKSWWIFLNMQAFHVIIHYVPCHHPLYVMLSSTKSHIYYSIDFLWLIACISHHEFTNEYCHVISLVSLLLHFTLKFCLKNSRSNARGIT
jgi:hypothetical protein